MAYPIFTFRWLAVHALVARGLGNRKKMSLLAPEVVEWRLFGMDFELTQISSGVDSVPTLNAFLPERGGCPLSQLRSPPSSSSVRSAPCSSSSAE